MYRGELHDEGKIEHNPINLAKKKGFSLIWAKLIETPYFWKNQIIFP
jgi:hypothetical protein